MAKPPEQWSIFELAFETNGPYDWTEFPLRVHFQNGSSVVELDAFWDGANTWRVRFSPSEPGEWRWSVCSVDTELDGKNGSFECRSPSETHVEKNANLRGHLRVSETGRHFTYADGTPFLYLGDTCRHMNEERGGLGQNEDGPFYVWMRDRKAKGFSVVNHWLYASGHPSRDEETCSRNEGGHAFEQVNGWNDFDRIRPEYFRSVDVRWKALWAEGFVMAGPPTWFAKPTRCASLKQAQDISRYVMARYSAYNLIWALSGEYSMAAAHGNEPWDKFETWRSLGAFIAAHNPFCHPVSIHPGPATYHVSSSQEFHDESWLDHNWLQTGQYPHGLYRVAQWSALDYIRKPAKPFLHSEGFYEGSVPTETANPYEAHWQSWVAFLNGACGAVYGCCSIWPFHDASDSRSYTWKDEMEWRDALKLPGSQEVGYVARFFRSYDWWRLAPCRHRLRLDGSPVPMPSEEDISPPHCAAIEGNLYVVYVPEGNADRTIVLTALPGTAFEAKWYDPREGTYTEIGQIHPDSDGSCVLPPRPESSGADWVFVLQSPAAKPQ